MDVWLTVHVRLYSQMDVFMLTESVFVQINV